MNFLLFLLLIFGLLSFCLEISHKLRPSSPLKLGSRDWEVLTKDGGLEVTGSLEIYNPHNRMEVMIPELKINPKLLGKRGSTEIKVHKKVIPMHPDQQSRQDNYWQAYILKAKSKTKVTIQITLDDQAGFQVKNTVENIWLEIYWKNYGPFGLLNMYNGLVIPLKSPESLSKDESYFKQYEDYQLLPIKTHILGVLDDPSEIIKSYTSKVSKKGDILTIGETPLAIMQGRYKNPRAIKPSFIARLLCRAFHPTSSLATACGLQSLIDIVGPSRVVVSWLLGIISKLLGFKGLFYIISGSQARLIDDITGTTPPYDQTIVFGPNYTKEFCEKTSSRLGIDVAVVDVNDLGRVKILAANKTCDKAFLRRALKTNPAGNSDEQTPLVLVRRSN